MKEAHILLVEDNDGDILLTLEAFEESTFNTKLSVVKNGKDALDFLLKKDKFKDVDKPDLVLLDLNIPIFNGLEVLQKIKENPSLNAISVIVLTTSSNPEEINQAENLQVNKFVTKPIEMTEFLNTISTIEEYWLQSNQL